VVPPWCASQRDRPWIHEHRVHRRPPPRRSSLRDHARQNAHRPVG
jgi:hypothetical protein